MNQRLTTTLLAGLALGTAVFAGENDNKPFCDGVRVDDPWQFKLSIPGWIPWLEGNTGLNIAAGIGAMNLRHG